MEIKSQLRSTLAALKKRTSLRVKSGLFKYLKMAHKKFKDYLVKILKVEHHIPSVSPIP